MNLVDALCIIASAHTFRGSEEEQVYNRARAIVEDHADRVMGIERRELIKEQADNLMYGHCNVSYELHKDGGLQ